MNLKTKTSTAVAAMVIAVIASLLGMKPDELTQQFANNAMAIDNYREARDIFWNDLYVSGGETLYCGEKFSSGYHSHINIEHVFPMSWVAWTLNCGERAQCRNNSDEFNRIEADLHNLYPAKVHINESRSSHPFGYVKGEKRRFGQCNFEIDFQKRVVEPREEVRGDIARAMFYMADRYQLEIRKKQYQTLKEWDKQDPVTETEKQRNRRIKSIQGNGNPYVEAE